MAVVLEVRSAQGNVTLLRINPGRNRITVRPGDTYRLIDDQTQYAPAGMSVKRADNHVVIDGFDRSAELAANPTVIELSDFYGTCSAATPVPGRDRVSRSGAGHGNAGQQHDRRAGRWLVRSLRPVLSWRRKPRPGAEG